jgi:hypothetical protein
MDPWSQMHWRGPIEVFLESRIPFRDTASHEDQPLLRNQFLLLSGIRGWSLGVFRLEGVQRSGVMLVPLPARTSVALPGQQQPLFGAA